MISLFKKKESPIKGAIIGAIIGDCMGAPYEFLERKDMKNFKLNKTALWTDDSSMLLCTIESLTKLNSFSEKDIADNFIKWLYHAHWTPNGMVLDCGTIISNALRNYRQKGIITGLKGERDCGNGSLMRILPILFYLHKNKENCMEDRFEIIGRLSSITHSHKRCIIGCSIYIELGLNILNGMNREEAYKKMQKTIINEFKDYQNVLGDYSNILYRNIAEISPLKLSGSGYVVTTLESSLYAFMTAKNYKDSLYRGIQFGEDTDTIACITGGLSGLYFGYNSIPKKWINDLARKEDIFKLCDEFESVYLN